MHMPASQVLRVGSCECEEWATGLSAAWASSLHS